MNFMKKVIGMVLAVSILTSCSSTIVDPDDMELAYSTETLGARTGASMSQRNEETPFRVGIVQYGSHDALDDTFIGIKRSLDDSNLNISFEYQNGNFDSDVTKVISKKMVSEGYDVIIPVGTPAALATFESAQYSQTPIIFSAISDPMKTGLVSNLTVPNSYITGTATLFDAKAQLDLIQSFQPDIQTIGVVYSLFEPNSIAELDLLRSEATKRNIEILSVGVSSVENITEATYSIITKVDALTNISDNNIVNNMDTILEISNIAQIPMYGSDKYQVEQGCIAGQGLDYILVGQKTADIAISVLSGKNISNIPVSIFDEVEFYYNDEVIESFDMKRPTNLTSKAS